MPQAAFALPDVQRAAEERKRGSRLVSNEGFAHHPCAQCCPFVPGSPFSAFLDVPWMLRVESLQKCRALPPFIQSREGNGAGEGSGAPVLWGS